MTAPARILEHCACGRPLHYTSYNCEILTRMMIKLSGAEYATVVSAFGTFLVQKHYMALHGLRAADLLRLADEGIIQRIG